MPKFFMQDIIPIDDRITLTGDTASHIKVLRLQVGDSVTICDGCCRDYEGTISSLSGSSVEIQINKVLSSVSEPQVLCSIYMAFAKSDKLEHVIQKATEIGAFEIVAFPSSRCVSRPDEKSLAKKQDRWQKIALSAAEQSGRGRIPQVRVLPDYTSALQEAGEKDLSILLYENEEQNSLRTCVSRTPFRTISLMTGPEGGFSTQEIEAAKSAGLQICTLGPRILRCETAPLCALSAVLFSCGELD